MLKRQSKFQWIQNDLKKKKKNQLQELYSALAFLLLSVFSEIIQLF